MPDEPFNMIISGMTGCGKTQYLLKALEKEYKGMFDYIIIVCPTILWNKSYTNWLPFHKDNCIVPICCEQDDVNKVLEIIQKLYIGTKTLIILDDCASGNDIKNRAGELVKLGFSARHYGLSVIVITQQFTSVAKPFRENISKLVTFYNTNSEDMDTLMKGYLRNINKNEKEKIEKQLKQHKHARLEIELRHPFTPKIACPQKQNK